MGRPGSGKSGYLPALDGLRAVAILGVLLAHDLPWSIAGHSDAEWHGLGGWGVELFFAISGVLICWRLLEDEQRTGRFRLGAFYVRRLFRIQPPALCYLAVAAVLGALGALPHNWAFWWAAVLSYANFLITDHTPPGAAAFLGHFWTLAVEEHFYVVLSLIFFVFRRYRVAVVACVLVALIEVKQFAIDKGYFTPHLSDRRSYWLLQYLLMPALFALLVRVPRVRAGVSRYFAPSVACLLTIVMMLINQRSVGAPGFPWKPGVRILTFIIVNQSMLFYGFGLIVVASMLHPRSWTTRVLELPVLRYIGRLSYSIYLWHIPFFITAYVPELVHSRLLLTLSERPWKYLATALLSVASYHFIEKPFIRWGHRLAPPATPGHRDLTETLVPPPTPSASEEALDPVPV